MSAAKRKPVRPEPIPGSPRRPAPPRPAARFVLPPTSQLATLRAWLAFAEKTYTAAGLALGQITTEAHDEALYLLLRTLDWPLDSDATCLDRPLDPAQRSALRRVLERRVTERIPAAYLTQEAWLGGHRFYVDERVLIPRSYFVELIPHLPEITGLPPEKFRQLVDVCTGSGCLALLLAHAFPQARVDAVDLSAEALTVAARNVADHQLAARVRLHRSDVFAQVPPPPPPGYDLILSNPPYEPSALCDDLPPEFQHEPRLALDGGKDGLGIIRRLLQEARARLAPHGCMVIEVGGLQDAMDAEFGHLDLEWLGTDDGADCICLIRAEALRA